MDSKIKLRSFMKKLRNDIDVNSKAMLDKAIFNNFIKSDFYLESNCIFIYVSYSSEVDTHNIIKRALLDGKLICVPKVINRDKGMEALIIRDFEELLPGAYGILEPHNNSLKVEPQKIDLIVLPGLAFDFQGGRLGYGGGFYDRFLCQTNEKTKKIALAYNNQIIEQVPMDNHDVPIDGIITDIKIHNISR